MNYTIRIFKYRFYVKEILLIFFMYLLMENTFSWLFIQKELYIEYYEKVVSLGVSAFMLYRFPSLKPIEKFCVGAFTFLMIRMCLESLYKYNTFFEQFYYVYRFIPSNFCSVYKIYLPYLRFGFA